MHDQEKRPSIGRNMLWNSAGSLAYLVCQWLLTVLVVPLGSFSAAGMLSLAISLTNFFFTIATFGMRVFQVSDGKGKYTPSLYVSTRMLTCLLSLGLCLVFLFCNHQYSLEQSGCILLYLLFRLGEALADVLAGEEQRANRFDYVGISYLLRAGVLLLSFTLTLYFSHSLPLALSLMSVCTLLVVLLFDLPRVKRITPLRLGFHIRDSLPLLREAWPLMLNAALLTLLAAIPRYFLEMYHGSEVMGFFGSVATPAVIIQAGCTFLYTPLIAPLTSYALAGRKRAYRRMVLGALGGLLLFAACVFLGAGLLGQWGLQLLFGEKILPYAYLLTPMLGTTLCISLIYFFEILLVIRRRLKTMMVIHLCSVAAAVVSSLLLVPTGGMDGVVQVLYLCAGGDMLCMGLAAWHAYRQQFQGCDEGGD